MTQPLLFNAFDMTSAMHNAHGLWKHPESERHRRYNDLHYWIEMAQRLEAGLFDAIFFADVLGVYDTYRQSKDPSIRDGMQFPLNDAALVIPAMASVTNHLSFVLTASTTYEHPFHIARRFSTLDHLTNGRIAWNIVTSYLPNAAKNFGLERMIAHDQRYEIADEFLEVTYKLWEGSWEEGARVEDREAGVLIDPNKVHSIDHQGDFFTVEGPHLCEPSPQRTPLLYQTGSSDRGRAFAAKHAECVFVGAPSPERIRSYIQDIRQQAERYGRDPQQLKFFTFLTVIVAKTTEQAKAKYEQLRRLWSADAAKAQFSGASGYDLAEYETKPPHEPFLFHTTDHGHYKAASLTKDAARPMTIGAALEKAGTLTRDAVIIGNPIEVADAIEERARRSGVDGFNLVHLITPKDLDDFIEYVVPILQRRGLYKTAYPPGTMREKLFGHGPHLPHHHPAAAFRSLGAPSR
ncbi:MULTISPECIES: LLM class flavin-dependent oxidoreductase [Geobacillus]|jgi:FMN-dependent oxidoreductase (nitrilotriacetate monooxygenase family)|uniref:LLM class flavin-dependent oxidoreductase n=1 Tax=Geobacillus TaxID=129337 RepID=UPI00017E6F35|nr:MULTISPECIES: LLM class flavin-dependent oxidoreductase [Geobacillus]MED4917491.1 LLM class flavin-dependent oxidoreductase [Geobacillus thermodenitrificans]NNU87906.1 LLM class flavin-dependent oxidoreductase [Geobacillus sp. MR]